MKKKKRWIKLMAVASIVAMLMSPATVSADMDHIQNYQDLLNASPNGLTYFSPEADFGWPQEETTVNLQTELMASGNTTWTIPPQITINYNLGKERIRSMDIGLDIQGKWVCTDGSYGTVVIENGGVMTVGTELSNNNDDSTFDNLTVKSGGTFNSNKMTAFRYGDVLNLEKDAIVNAPGFYANDCGLYLRGGTINAPNGATKKGGILLDFHAGNNNVINGELTVDTLYPTGDYSIRSKIHVKDRFNLGSDETLVVEKGAVLDLQDNWDSLFRGTIHVKSGGELNVKNYSINEDGKIIIDQGGVLKAERLILEGSGYKIQGKGKIVLNNLNSNDIASYSSAVASTITFEHNGDCLKGKETAIKDGYIWSKCALCDKLMLRIKKVPTPTKSPKPSELKVGTSFNAGGLTYKVTQIGKSRTVALVKAPRRTAVSIPARVTYKGKSYTVTSIGNKAFYNNKTVIAVTVPSSVKVIGTQAFSTCTRLKKINGFANVTSIGKQAFYKCSSLNQIGKKSKTITLSKIQQIGSGAFQNCTKITKLTISSKSLKSVGSKAISKINKKTVIKVPSSKLSRYKKLFKSSTGYVRSMKISK